MPSAGKAFQRSSAQGRKFAHTRPQSIRKIKAITLKQNATKYSAMLQCSETKLFIHHWNHAWHSSKDFFSTSWIFDMVTLEFTSASQGRIWWQIHSPRNKWICMNLLGKCSFTGVCMRTETDQLLQLQMHGCKCQMLPRAPSIQWMLHLALLKQGCQADCRALASTGPVALGKWSIFAMALASLPQMSPSACSPWLHCKRRGHWPSRGSLANSYWVAVPSKWHIGAKWQGSRLGQ